MKDITKVYALDALLHKATFSFLGDLSREVGGMTNAVSFKLFISFYLRTDQIKNGILGLCREREIYSAKILYRSLIEHTLRFIYLNFRHKTEGTDEAAIEYELFSELSEDAEYGKAWQEYFKILRPDTPKKDLWEILKRTRPEFSKYTAKEIEEKAAQFRYKRIIKYAESEMAKAEKDLGRSVVRLIPDYSELSSYVHGGATANNFFIWTRGESDIADAAYSVSDNAIAVSMIVKRLTFQSVRKFDTKYDTVCQLIDQISVNHQMETLGKVSFD
jgi:hypothetical protein